MGNREDAAKHLRVFEDRSEYHSEDSTVETFDEGVLTVSAKARIQNVKRAFEDGFLENVILGVTTGGEQPDLGKISDAAQQSISGLVDSLTSEVGRALIGLSIMQMCIKAIEPEQNIRLHKGGHNSRSFSWAEGISMRTLDNKYVTPTLRKHGLLKLNADGFMMTRSLAENYPYTALYKANLRGARSEWLALVDEIESRSTDSLESLKLLILKLNNAALHFNETADKLMAIVDSKIDGISTRAEAKQLLVNHIDISDHAARLLEVGMHALFQTLIELGTLGNYELKPLSQMRSANKKHGNIGDIELLENDEIIESWDAKYGKGYLREEIEEVSEKAVHHDSVQIAGFVTTANIERRDEISTRISEIEDLHGVRILVMALDEWIDYVFDRGMEGNLTSEDELSRQWIRNYCLCLAQKRREQAPIDEPCLEWVNSLIEVFNAIARGK